MSINKFKSTRIFGELIVEDLSGNTNANTVLNRDLSVTGKITTAKIVSPFNSLINLSFLGIFPTTAVADSNAGLGFFWNSFGGQGETDMICYGQGGPGGLALFGANNSTAPTLISKLYPSYIEFSTTPYFPTSNTIGAIGATTQYINNVLSSYLTTANAASTYLTGTTASLIYQPITLMGDYVTGIYASATFLTQSSASSIYQTISGMSNYITRGGEIPFNINLAKFTFPSSFPTSAVNNNATGPAFFWNQSGGQGETDMICYGQGSSGGLSIYGGGNTTNPASTLICRLWNGLIDFSTTPTFPTSNTIGAIGATTAYVDNRLSSNITTRKQTWFLSSNSVGNSYTPANRNIGSSYNSNSPKWDKITTYGGASSSNWYITDGIFTAYESGTYNFQMCFFTTQTTKVGRFLRAKGSCVLGGSQYLSFNQGYLDNYGAFTISLMYYMYFDDTFFLECENESPNFYYDDGHTTMQIIKIS